MTMSVDTIAFKTMDEALDSVGRNFGEHAMDALYDQHRTGEPTPTVTVKITAVEEPDPFFS